MIALGVAATPSIHLVILSLLVMDTEFMQNPTSKFISSGYCWSVSLIPNHVIQHMEGKKSTYRGIARRLAPEPGPRRASVVVFGDLCATHLSIYPVSTQSYHNMVPSYRHS